MLGLALFLPHFFTFTIDTTSKTCIHESPTYYYVSSAFVSFLLWFLVAVVLTVNCTRSLQHLWRGDLFDLSSLLKRRKQITLLLLGLTATFFILTTPVTIYFILRASGHFRDTNGKI